MTIFVHVVADYKFDSKKVEKYPFMAEVNIGKDRQLSY